ncbi:hypothetical protein [Fretibacter rubidus]|uniref:hypothetical protein n=1 Tax=Fretibacter rubidus TaxID=570162 RepID=UPI00352A799B
MKKFIVSATILTLCSHFAVAEDIPETEKCFSVDSVSKMYKKIDKLKDSRRDSVDTVVKAYFADAQTRAVPMSLYIKNGDTRDMFEVSEDGEIKEFHSKTKMLPDTAELCGATRADGKIGMGMGMDVQFKSASGTHSMAEVMDGLKDGKSHYKATLPGPMAMFVPKMTHAMVTYEDLDTPPDIKASVNGAVINAPVALFGKAHVVDVDALEEMGAESLIINGGPYTLAPVPSIKKMKSLGFGPDQDEGKDDGNSENNKP